MSTTTVSEGWRICASCPPDDNEWPASCFTNSSGSVRFAICNDCWTSRYVRVKKPCEACGRAASTWRTKETADQPVRHRVCKRGEKREKFVTSAPRCVVCNRPHYLSKGDKPPKRGFVVCHKCLPDLPPEYEPRLVQNERNALARILSERKRRAA